MPDCGLAPPASFRGVLLNCIQMGLPPFACTDASDVCWLAATDAMPKAPPLSGLTSASPTETFPLTTRWPVFEPALPVRAASKASGKLAATFSSADRVPSAECFGRLLTPGTAARDPFAGVEASITRCSPIVDLLRSFSSSDAISSSKSSS